MFEHKRTRIEARRLVGALEGAPATRCDQWNRYRGIAHSQSSSALLGGTNYRQ